jgi:hypothetical protein
MGSSPSRRASACHKSSVAAGHADRVEAVIRVGLVRRPHRRKPQPSAFDSRVHTAKTSGPANFETQLNRRSGIHEVRSHRGRVELCEVDRTTAVNCRCDGRSCRCADVLTRSDLGQAALTVGRGHPEQRAESLRISCEVSDDSG